MTWPVFWSCAATEQDSTEMPEEIGAGDAEFLLGEIPRQLRERGREHQRQDRRPGPRRPSAGGAGRDGR